MNIVEAYIKFFDGLLIIVTGLGSCGIDDLAENIVRDFKIKRIQAKDYIKSDLPKVSLPDGTSIINIYNDDAIDWDKLNKDLKEFKKHGIVLTGPGFPTYLIEIAPDYHIHLNISKQNCVDLLNKDQPEEVNKRNKMIMNQLMFPFYLEITKREKINKFININGLDSDQIYDLAFDTLIDFIQKSLDKLAASLSDNKYKKEPISTRSDKHSDDLISISMEQIDEPEYLNKDLKSTLDEILLNDELDTPTEGDGPVEFY